MLASASRSSKKETSMFSRPMLTCAAIAFASTLAFAAPAGAQSDNSMTTVPCERADTVMMPGASHMAATMPAATGDLDKDFTAMMLFNERAMSDMAKLEVRCGKDPKVKESAQSVLLRVRSHRLSGDSI